MCDKFHHKSMYEGSISEMRNSLSAATCELQTGTVSENVQKLALMLLTSSNLLICRIKKSP